MIDDISYEDVPKSLIGRQVVDQEIKNQFKKHVWSIEICRSVTAIQQKAKNDAMPRSKIISEHVIVPNDENFFLKEFEQDTNSSTWHNNWKIPVGERSSLVDTSQSFSIESNRNLSDRWVCPKTNQSKNNFFHVF